MALFVGHPPPLSGAYLNNPPHYLLPIGNRRHWHQPWAGRISPTPSFPLGTSSHERRRQHLQQRTRFPIERMQSLPREAPTRRGRSRVPAGRVPRKSPFATNRFLKHPARRSPVPRRSPACCRCSATVFVASKIFDSPSTILLVPALRYSSPAFTASTSAVGV